MSQVYTVQMSKGLLVSKPKLLITDNLYMQLYQPVGCTFSEKERTTAVASGWESMNYKYVLHRQKISTFAHNWIKLFLEHTTFQTQK